MKMKKTILCLVSAFLILLTAAFAAYADCRWDDDNYGIRAEWDSTNSKVTLQLYKGSSYKVGGKVRLSSGTTSFDFTDKIRAMGPGSYKFTVTDEAGRTYESDMYQADENIVEELQNNKWYFENGMWLLKNYKGEILRGWQSDNGKWYYLDTVTGACRMDTTTPDGYHVGPDGAWDGMPAK